MSDRIRFAAVMVAAMLLQIGCGGETDPQPDPPATASAQSFAESPAIDPPPVDSTVDGDDGQNTESQNADSSTGTIAATVDASGRKWLTPEVPYDVFPGLPTEQEIAAAGSSPAAPQAAAATDDAPMIASTDRSATESMPAEPMPAPAEPMPAEGEAPASSGDGWDGILSLEVLRNEISAINNDLGRNLLTVGSYNGSFEQVSIDGWVMSSLATIASEYPAPISWKANALLARDAAVAVAMSATARGRASFNETQLAGEQLSAVLNNNTPPGLANPDPSASREETADRAALMARMQTAFDRLKSVGGDEASFTAGRDTAAHEAAILAALAKFTSHSNYGSADEPDYQTAARQLIAAGTAMSAAATADEPASFKTALDGVSTACNACHQKYRFGN